MSNERKTREETQQRIDRICRDSERELRGLYNTGLVRALGIVRSNENATTEELVKLIEWEIL